MEIPLFADIIIILGLAVIVILIFQKLRLPTILGYLITGLIAGPSGLNLVQQSHQVDTLSEVGVILLLFIIGLEFSLRDLYAIRKYVFVGGTAQVILTILAANIIGYAIGYNFQQSLFLGFLFALSSTAIVLKILQERLEVNTPHGKVILAILIFQDIAVVPMMLLLPLLSGESENIGLTLLLLLLKGLLIVVFVYVSARYVVPKLLFLITRTGSKELFLISTLVICLATAWLTSSMGLSLSLGAFLAGLIISESEYNHQATSNIIPFREVFSSFFFVSIGMLLDLSFLGAHLIPILLFTALVFFLKGFLSSVAAYVLGFPIRTVLLVGLSLFQVGEFAFILSKEGLNKGLLGPNGYQYFLSVSLLTMAATPFVIGYSEKISKFIIRLIPDRWQQDALKEEVVRIHELNDHIVIIGYGITGQHIAMAARKTGIAYNILELNSETVRREREKGEPIMYGDAVHPHILTHLGIQRARVAVVAISDNKAMRQIITSIRNLSSSVYIISRTSFLTEMEEVLHLGADDVIPEDLETSVEIFTRVLNKYLVPNDEIQSFIDRIRSDNYNMMRSFSTDAGFTRPSTLDFASMTTASLRVQHLNQKLIGKTVEQANLREHFGITILAIKRQDKLIDDVTADTRLKEDDVLYVFGNREAVRTFEQALKKPPA
jgi:CPA2 family monovalent cation:H+ antiporter-2